MPDILLSDGFWRPSDGWIYALSAVQMLLYPRTILISNSPISALPTSLLWYTPNVRHLLYQCSLVALLFVPRMLEAPPCPGGGASPRGPGETLYNSRMRNALCLRYQTEAAPPLRCARTDRRSGGRRRNSRAVGETSGSGVQVTLLHEVGCSLSRGKVGVTRRRAIADHLQECARTAGSRWSSAMRPST